MKKIRAMSISEFDKYKEELKLKVEELNKDNRGYSSVLCELFDEVTRTAGTNDELMFTATQLKEIYRLAK
ncbi:hypothetical protein [Faecalicatena contorta]|uniref:hypothetical protein n=1 Tax=Faecalicatena contorta TaxID=39482 RepID=UPI001F38C9D9|nr:hypothetical protein [Faecalicatena contorta]MCF2555573.1 hypothetical protein [Faecalicatena contorta]